MIIIDQIVDAGLISLLLFGLQKLQNVSPQSMGVRKMFKQAMPVPYGLGTLDGTLMIALILLLAHLFTKPMLLKGSRKDTYEDTAAAKFSKWCSDNKMSSEAAALCDAQDGVTKWLERQKFMRKGHDWLAKNIGGPFHRQNLLYG